MKNKEINLSYSFSLYSLLRRGIGIAIIVILSSLLFNKNQDYNEILRLNEVATKELELSKNREGELVAKMESFETRKAEDFLKFATKDSLTRELQNEIKQMKRYLKRQGSVTNFSTEAKTETSAKTTIIKDENGYPIYKSNFNLDGWVFGSSVATVDSTYYNIGYKDKYSLTIGTEPTGFLGLGKGKAFAQVTSSSPYNTVKTMKTYQVSLPKKKSFSLAPSVNYGVGLTGEQQITVGVSLQYNKLSIKF